MEKMHNVLNNFNNFTYVYLYVMHVRLVLYKRAFLLGSLFNIHERVEMCCFTALNVDTLI